MTDPKLIEAVARAYAKIADGAVYDAMPPESREMYAKRVMPIITAYEAARGDVVWRPDELVVGGLYLGKNGKYWKYEGVDVFHGQTTLQFVMGSHHRVNPLPERLNDLLAPRAMIAAAKGES